MKSRKPFKLLTRLWPGNALGLAWRNVFRHRGRTALTLTVIATGVAGLILSGGFVQDSLIQLREATIHSQLGHLQIYKKNFFEKGSLGSFRYLIEQPAEVHAALNRMAEVDSVMERLAFVGIINNGRSDIPIIAEGVEPEKEARLGTSIQFLEGRALAGADPYEMIVGEGVAAATKLKVGDRATLLVTTAEGARNDAEFEIVGIFRSFSKDFDAHAVRIPIAGAKELVASNAINAMVVTLSQTESTDVVATRLGSVLAADTYEVKTWHELADFYDKTAALYDRQFSVLQSIILVAVFLSVINSVNMSIFERTGEFGTLMALGTRRRSLFGMVLLENLLLGLIGGFMGALIGIVAARVISSIGIPMPPPPNSSAGYIAAIRIDPGIVLPSLVIGLLATVVAAVLPARRVSKIPVVDALRQN